MLLTILAVTSYVSSQCIKMNTGSKIYTSWHNFEPYRNWNFQSPKRTWVKIESSNFPSLLRALSFQIKGKPREYNTQIKILQSRLFHVHSLQLWCWGGCNLGLLMWNECRASWPIVAQNCYANPLWNMVSVVYDKYGNMVWVIIKPIA